MEPVVVIGAGAAGIMAALRAAELGAPVLLLEKTSRIGTKILISGGGKCNLAHDGPLEDVIRAFRPNEARFIRPACYRLPNHAIIQFFTDRGLAVYTRPNGRVFPVHQTAKDVVAILKSELISRGVDVRMECPVVGIEKGENAELMVRCGIGAGIGSSDPQNPTTQTHRAPGAESRATYPSRHVTLAVGGCSFPLSGTTGDGWDWAQKLGHGMVPVRAALAPMALEGKRWKPYSGVALRDCVLKARQNANEIAKWRGDLLFTHFGLSGPCALGVSREVAEGLESGPVEAEVDVLPDRTFESLSEEILEYARAHPLRRVATLLETHLPERLIDEMLRSAQIADDQAFKSLEKKARNRLIACLKGWKLGRIRESILDKGEVAAGGIPLDEVDPQTMRSLKCAGLYCCGEALDVAGPVGGYNLQSAFATGYVAGETAAKDWLSHPANVGASPLRR